MDFTALAASLTTALLPLLPYLLKVGEGAASETGKSIASTTLQWGQSLWTKLQPKVEAKPAALEAAQDAALKPDNNDAQGALRLQLAKLLESDQSLADEVKRWLDEGKASGNITIGGNVVTASGDRSIAIGGNATNNTFNTNDQK